MHQAGHATWANTDAYQEQHIQSWCNQVFSLGQVLHDLI